MKRKEERVCCAEEVNCKRKKEDTTHVNDIPDEILAVIMGYLGTQCFRCQLICKKWRYAFRNLYTFVNPPWDPDSPNTSIIWKMDGFSLSPSLFERFIFDEKYKDTYCRHVARNGNLELLKWFRGKDCDWMDAGEIMVREGNLDMLDWSLDNGCEVDFCIINNAVEKGDIDALEIIKKYDSCQFGEYAYFEAIIKGHLHVLEWLHEKGCPMKPCFVSRAENHVCDLEAWMCTKAVGCLRLEVLKWLRDHNCPWWEDMCICVDVMDVKNTVHVICRFMQRGLSRKEAIGEMRIARSEIVAWLNANNCPCGGKYHQEKKNKFVRFFYMILYV
jgi:hypothetical protein